MDASPSGFVLEAASQSDDSDDSDDYDAVATHEVEEEEEEAPHALTQYLSHRATNYKTFEQQRSLIKPLKPSLVLSASWRTRDSIHSLIDNRTQLFKKLKIPFYVDDENYDGADDCGSSNRLIMNCPPFVKKSNEFDIEEGLQSLQNDATKIEIVQDTFSIAALSVVHALKHQLKQIKQYEEEQQNHHENDEDDDDEDDDIPLSSLSLSKNSELPPLIQILEKIDQAKNKCFEKALDHDNLVKSVSSSSSRKRKSSSSPSTQQNTASSSTTTKNKDIVTSPKKKKSRPSASSGAAAASGATGIDPSSSINTSSGDIVSPTTSSNTTVDTRLTTSRAILCSAASIVFKNLTPKYTNVDNGDSNDDTDIEYDQNHYSNDINILDVPQNTHQSSKLNMDGMDDSDTKEQKQPKQKESKESKPSINMGAVTMSAKIFAQRSIEQALGATKRSENRRKWRMDCSKRTLLQRKRDLTRTPFLPSSGSTHQKDQQPHQQTEGILTKWLSWTDPFSKLNDIYCVTEGSSDEDDEKEDSFDEFSSFSRHNYGDKHHYTTHQSEEWEERCLPRMIDIMNVGPGHVILQDLQWKTRFQRVLGVLAALGTKRETNSSLKAETYFNEPNYGPHLIITTEADFGNFMSALAPLDYSVSSESPFYLRSLGYYGSAKKRRRIRVEHFTSIGVISGLIDTPYNVVVTTYKTFVQDYLHFCQIPFQAVVLDDGMSWLGVGHFDPNGKLGSVFDKGIWNQSDNHAGSAGARLNDWDFSIDTNSQKIKEQIESKEKRILIGLTARHRIIISNSMHTRYRGILYSSPVPGLLSFFFPQFGDVVREEWDRSRIQGCIESIEHIRKLLCRSIVVHTGFDACSQSMYSLALLSMTGELRSQDDKSSTDLRDSISESECVDEKTTYISEDAMIADGKIVQSRRFAASWLRPGSAICNELGGVSLGPIIDAIKSKNASGHVCQEIVTSSSLTSSGAGGAISGAAAFKTAVRCGRTFTSEQGLRQHISALHAPPGTWLCRSCGSDCGTSQARTHHERSCGTDKALVSPNAAKENPLGGGIPTVGQASKKKKKSSMSSGKGHDSDTKDKDGCIRVPGYSGVWVNPKGNHFVKIDGKAFTREGDEVNASTDDPIILFDSVEEAAKMYDTVMKEQKGSKKTDLKLNFKPDGSRIVYDTKNAVGRNLEMLGGGASSVVPALSVINIKDLPKGVVPLLRDPKQTLRTGGNSKRHVYAYRGVCRQARKSHDRWQSQISFGGQNHYLGTFDSEWDAAAIYAWAHLILYGEEATKKAQEEGEQAVAAYEKEQKDIAEGKIPVPAPSKAKKKKKPTISVRKGKKKTEKTSTTCAHSFLEYINPSYPKMSSGFQGIKVSSEKDDDTLIMDVTARILASRRKVNDENFFSSFCVPVSKSTSRLPTGCALLLGLSSVDFGWNMESFFDSVRRNIGGNEEALNSALESEFGNGGMNTRFRTIIKGFPCIIGKASKHLEEAASTLGFYGAGLGGTIGDVDCNIGGIDGSCREMSAIISYSSKENSFQLTANGKDDYISVNGTKIDALTGTVTIENRSICSVGSRVFMFLLPSN